MPVTISRLIRVYGRADMYVAGDVVALSMLDGLEIDLGEVFDGK